MGGIGSKETEEIMENRRNGGHEPSLPWLVKTDEMPPIQILLARPLIIVIIQHTCNFCIETIC